MPTTQPNFSICQNIINTICYADIFSYPLTAEEIYLYYSGPTRVSKSELLNQLQHLVSNQRVIESPTGVGESAKLYCLPHRQKIFSLRKKRSSSSQAKVNLARRVGKWLKKIPTIEAIFLTGSVAVNNANQKDDIDLMLITKPHLLWTTRLITNLILDTIKIRRKPEHHHSNQYHNKICINLLLDSSNLTLDHSRRNLFTAHELVQAKLIWQRQPITNLLYSQNSWLTTFLPHSPLPKTKKTVSSQKKPFNIILKLFFPFEKLAFWTQIWYMKRKQTHEEVGPTKAFFHPRDTAKIILNQYKTRIKAHQLNLK